MSADFYVEAGPITFAVQLGDDGVRMQRTGLGGDFLQRIIRDLLAGRRRFRHPPDIFQQM